MTDDHVEGAVPRVTASRLRRALVVEAPGDIAEGCIAARPI